MTDPPLGRGPPGPGRVERQPWESPRPPPRPRPTPTLGLLLARALRGTLTASAMAPARCGAARATRGRGRKGRDCSYSLPAARGQSAARQLRQGRRDTPSRGASPPPQGPGRRPGSPIRICGEVRLLHRGLE